MARLVLAVALLACPRLAAREGAPVMDPLPGGEDDSALAQGGEAGSSPAGETDRGRGARPGTMDLAGVLTQSYRLRRSRSDSDQDVYGYLSLDGAYRSPGDGEERPDGRFGFSLQASYNLDIDAFPSGATATRFMPFVDLSNTFGRRLQTYLHSAYFEVEDLAWLERLRVGRQQIYREEGLLFDGAHVRTRPWKTIALEAYGGLPAHLYESSASGDLLMGLGLEMRPVNGLKLGGDYIFLRDGRKDLPDSEDRLWILRGSYLIGREWTVNATASWVGNRDRRQLVELQYVSADLGLLARLRAVRQNGIVDFYSDELSSFVLVQGRYAPYWEYHLDISQPVGDHLGVGGGVHVRHLQDSSDDGLFNHSFRNYYLSVEVQDPWKGGRVSLQGDVWDADGEDIQAVALEVEQKVMELARIRIGTSYSLYRFDPLTGDERERDRVYYARLRWYLTSHLDLDTDYQYEKDSVTEYHRLTVNVRVTL